jgi:hypothetical protein
MPSIEHQTQGTLAKHIEYNRLTKNICFQQGFSFHNDHVRGKHFKGNVYWLWFLKVSLSPSECWRINDIKTAALILTDSVSDSTSLASDQHTRSHTPGKHAYTVALEWASAYTQTNTNKHTHTQIIAHILYTEGTSVPYSSIHKNSITLHNYKSLFPQLSIVKPCFHKSLL